MHKLPVVAAVLVMLAVSFIAGPSAEASGGAGLAPTEDCQGGAVTITYDASKPGLEGLPACITQGAVVTLLVKGVNPFLYEVNIASELVTRHVAVPEIFSRALTVPAEEEPGDVVAPRLSTDAAAARAFSAALTTFYDAIQRAYSKAAVEAILVNLMFADVASANELRNPANTAVSVEFAGATNGAGITRGGADAVAIVDRRFEEVRSQFVGLGSPVEVQRQQVERAQAAMAAFDRDRETLRKSFQNAAEVFDRILAIEFSAAGGTVTATGDELTISLEIKRRANVPETFPTQRTRDKEDLVKLEIFGGTRVNFSGGLFFSTLTDKSFTTNAENKITENTSEQDDAAVAVGSLVHVYPNWRHSVYPALSFGVGLGANTELQYFMGGSVIFGRERRWILSGGAALGKTTDLGGDLKKDDEFVGEGDIPTATRVRWGSFFAFSFNFGS